MSTLQIVVKGDNDFSSTGLGKFSPLPFADDLFAAYAMGNRYGLGPLVDNIGRRGNLQVAGSPVVGDYASSLSSAGYFETPFTGAELMAQNGAGCIVSVALVPQAQQSTLAAAFRLIPSSNGIGLVTRSDTRKLAAVDLGGSTELVLNSTADRASGYEVSIASFGPSGKRLYRRRAGFTSAETSLDATPAGSGGGPNRIAIGYMPGSGGFAGSSQAALVLFYTRDLLAAGQGGQVYDGLRKFLDGRIAL